MNNKKLTLTGILSLKTKGKWLQSRQAFTLVELIVVITILAILGTIAFISLSGYSKSSRDSVRISDVSNMKTSLELFHLNAGKYPLPDNYEIVDYGGETLWYQGTFGTTVVSQLSRNISEIPTDSLSDKEYIYSVANNKNEYQILNLLEGDLVLNTISQTNAANTTRIPKVDGQYNGVFIKTSTDIIPTPSLITSEEIPTGAGLTLDSTNIKSQIITGGKNIPNIGSVNSATGKLNINLSVYNGTITKDSSDIDKENVMQAIQGAYTGSELSNSDVYAYILSKTTTEDLLVLLDTVVLGNSSNLSTTTQEINGCSITKPLCDGVGCTLVTGTATSINQSWVKDGADCGFTCNLGYSGINCENYIEPIPSCTAAGQIKYEISGLIGTSDVGLTCNDNIIVCSGNNTGYIIDACNLGATIVYTNQTFSSATAVRNSTVNAWAGGLYQWGNNGEISYSTNSVTQVNTISPITYGPGNYYNSPIFISNSFWAIPQNDNLWGSGGTVLERQGPCPSNYHLPTSTEWNGILNAGGWGQNGANLSQQLKLPIAGYRIAVNLNMDSQGSIAYYISTTPINSSYKSMAFASGVIMPDIENGRSYGNSIRCFKN